ncbi:MAG: hypothetical protein DSY77_06985, partial [Bacteroidetes bacterium]
NSLFSVSNDRIVARQDILIEVDCNFKGIKDNSANEYGRGVMEIYTSSGSEIRKDLLIHNALPIWRITHSTILKKWILSTI